MPAPLPPTLASKRHRVMSGEPALKSTSAAPVPEQVLLENTHWSNVAEQASSAAPPPALEEFPFVIVQLRTVGAPPSKKRFAPQLSRGAGAPPACPSRMTNPSTIPVASTPIARTRCWLLTG